MALCSLPFLFCFSCPIVFVFVCLIVVVVVVIVVFIVDDKTELTRNKNVCVCV